MGANVSNCTIKKLAHWPQSLELNTDWLIMTNSEMTHLCDVKDYIARLSLIDLRNSSVNKLCDGFLKFVSQNNLPGSMRRLELANNELIDLPELVVEIKNVIYTLSGNRFHCGCDMLWMVDWLGNATTPFGEPVVEDYTEVTCYSGQMIGTAIYKLKAVDMGCYPHELAKWTVITLSSIGCTIFILLCMLAILIKRWNDFRWLIYRYFNKFIKKWKTADDLGGVLFDAYLSYR